MKMGIRLAAGALALGVVGTADAGSVIIDGLGGAVTMNSKTIGGVFGAGTPTFTEAALNHVHADLQAGGISTEGVVTFLLADTDHGLSFLALVDDNNTGNDFDGFTSSLGMTSTAPITGVEFVNDQNSDITNLFDNANGTQTAAGIFRWDDENKGDGFAWAELETGDFVSFNFTRRGGDLPTHPGLEGDETFQFVSWTGSAWEVLATGEFSQANQFAFSFTVIPLPAPVLLGLAGLGVVAAVRRRMA